MNRVSLRVVIGMTAILLLGLIATMLPAGGVQHSAVGTSLSGPAQRVNGHALRRPAIHDTPDISTSFAVWADERGTVNASRQHSVWAKDLRTRAESRVAAIATQFVAPKVSGTWVVWEDWPNGNAEVFARNLATGQTVTVAGGPSNARSPAIDGTTVVWQDDRNKGTSGIDIYMRTLPNGPEFAVTTDPGDQTNPMVSGNTVLWKNGDGSVSGRIGTGSEFKLTAVNGAPRLSGNTVVWQVDNTVTVRTCQLPCSTATALLNGSDPAISGNRVAYANSNNNFVRVLDLSNGITSQVSSAPAQVGAYGGIALQGDNIAWVDNVGHTDVYWENLTTKGPPLRANSVGSGSFSDHRSPAAYNNTVGYLAPGAADFQSRLQTFQPRFAVYATDLSGNHRDFRISSRLSTAPVGPRIDGPNVVWGDDRRCTNPAGCRYDVFENPLSAPGVETQLSAPNNSGGPPDIFGRTVAWSCTTTKLCVDIAGATRQYAVGGNLSYPAGNVKPVRTSNGVVVFDNGELRALEIATGRFEILSRASPTGFDTSRGVAVWTTADRLIASYIKFNGPLLDGTSVATTINRGLDTAAAPTTDGMTVGWSEGPSATRQVYVQRLSEKIKHAVPTLPGAQDQPNINNGNVYWVQFNDQFSDIYMASLTGTTVFTPDNTPPGPVSGVSISRSGSDISLSWVNPGDSDLSGIRILRTVVPAPAASSPDDPSAAVVFDTQGTSFVDSDIVAGVAYRYTLFAYDEVPNYASGVLATSPP